MVTKWQFVDPSTAQSYQFEINPNEDGLPGYQKTISTQTSTAPGTEGNVIVFEGRDEPRQGSFSGVTLSQSQHEAFITWFNKRNQIQVVDDLGRTFSIIITAYKPTRRWARSHNWRHDYTIDYLVVDWQ